VSDYEQGSALTVPLRSYLSGEHATEPLRDLQRECGPPSEKGICSSWISVAGVLCPALLLVLGDLPRYFDQFVRTCWGSASTSLRSNWRGSAWALSGVAGVRRGGIGVATVPAEWLWRRAR
jgi:hypothetical protein